MPGGCESVGGRRATPRPFIDQRGPAAGHGHSDKPHPASDFALRTVPRFGRVLPAVVVAADVVAPGGACVDVLACCGGVVESEWVGGDGGGDLEDELAQGGDAGGAHGQAVVAAAGTPPVTATRGVGVPGQACAVRPWIKGDAHRVPNGGTWPRSPARTAASRAVAQVSQARPMAPQAAAISSHPSEALPAANGGRGPMARLTPAARAARRGWPGLCRTGRARRRRG
jgi:hypothetical protein